jgi:hypothetical protein
VCIVAGGLHHAGAGPQGLAANGALSWLIGRGHTEWNSRLRGIVARRPTTNICCSLGCTLTAKLGIDGRALVVGRTEVLLARRAGGPRR